MTETKKFKFEDLQPASHPAPFLLFLYSSEVINTTITLRREILHALKQI